MGLLAGLMDTRKEETGNRRPLKFFALDYATMVGFLAYSSSATATPICLVAISRELSLSLSQAGGLEVGRGALVILTLLGSGFIGAKLGKARALGWSSLLLGVGMGAYSMAPGYGALLMAFGLMGLGGGVMEALINPLVQELHPEDSGRYLNLINAFWSIGVLLTMVGTGEALSGVCFVSGFLFLALQRWAPRHARQSMAAVLREKWAILTARRFWTFCAMMFFAGAAEGAFTFWSASLLQLHHGAAPRTAGFGVALFAGGMIAARLAFGWLVPQRQLWRLLMFSALGAVAVSIAVPFIESIPLAQIALFVAGVSVACFWPTLQSYAVDRIQLDATGIFILLSCGGVAGFSAISWAMGMIGDRYGLQSSFWLIPLSLAALIGLLAMERRAP